MRNTKLWAVLLAFVLLCGCTLGILFTGANAAGEVVYGVGYTEGIDEDKQFETFRAAFEAVEKAIEKGEWTEGNTLVIKFAGEFEAKVENSELLFGQKTIFTSTGKKLPITIQGTEESDASTVTVSAAQIACANDYTFKDLTLDLHSYVVGTATFDSTEYNVGASFFAGSGNVTLNNVATFHLGSHVFGDNYTAEAFEGWTEADVEALKDEDGCLLSSVTFTGTGFASTEVLGSTSTNSIDAGPCAVGATRNSETGEDAYAAVISENLTITPADTKAMLEVTSGTLNSRLGGYMAQYPARVHTAIIRMTGGSVNSVTGDEAGGHVLNNIENGNVEVYVKDVEKAGTVRIFYGGKGHHDMTNTANAPAGEYGNVTVYCENVKKGGSVYIDGSSNKIIPGKAKVTLKNFYHNGKSTSGEMTAFEYLGLAALGGVENNLTKCKLTGYSGCRFENAPSDEIGGVVNNLTDVNYAGNSNKWNYNPVAMRNNGVGVKVKSVTNNLTDCIIGSSTTYAISFYGTRSSVVSGTVKNVLNDTTFNYAYYGSNYGSAARVENYYNAGSTFEGEIRGTNNGTVGTAINEVDGATVNGNLQGTYNSIITGKVETTVKSGTLKALYVAFGHSSSAIGDIVNNIYGGTFNSDIMFGGYGGTSIKSVTTNIYDGNFNNKDKFIAFASGNNNWTSQVLGDVVNNIYGGTFKQVIYGGARGGCVQGDIYNNVKSGTFKNSFYGGNYGPTYYKDGYTYYNNFLNMGVEGTIYNVVGEKDKPETAPVFEKTFYGGDCGVIADNAYANKSNCTIENTVWNGTFTDTYYGGNARNAYISKQIDLDPYSIELNITNNIHNGTFLASFFGGSASSAHDATEGTTIAAGVSGGTITNNLYKADIASNYLGGIGTGSTPMTIDLVNNFWAVTLRTEHNYLGHGANRPTTGTITNTFYEGFNADTAYVYGAGAGVVTPPAGKTVAVTNVINGGNFTGFWGAGGNANLILNADVETTVYGGTFNVYNSSSINGIAGGTRNGTLNGKATLNIYDGTFIGQVCGGTYLGDAAYKDRLITGSTELNIYGGDFKRSVFTCSPTATIYATEGSTLNIVPTAGKALAFYSQVKDIDTFDASADVVVDIGKNTLLEIASLTGTLQVNQKQQWLARTYVTVADADAAILYTTSDGVLGSASLIEGEAAVELRGNGIDIQAATLLLSDKIKIKLMFAEDDVVALPEDYEFTFTAANGTVLAKVNADNIGQAKDGYYTVVLSALGLGDFDMTIACEGNYLYSSEMTVIGLADQGAKHYTETAPNTVNAQLFKTIADLGRKANEQDALYGSPVTETVNWTASKAPEAVDPTRLNMQTMGLVMTDAIGIRLTGETVAADTPLQFWVNGKNVTSYCVITRSETADETSGKFGFTVDMYVNVSMMTSELNILITDDAETAMFTMTVRVDALAEKIYAANQNELTSYALAYIQAADAYIKAQEV